MILLTVRELSRQFDTEPVFANVTFDVHSGERIGLVGPNGTGKTTLLRILAGFDDADVGSVERHPTTDIALLEQEMHFESARTLFEEARSGLSHLYQKQDDAERLAEAIAAETDDANRERLQRRYDSAQEELDRLGAYNVDHRVREVLRGLGFQTDEYDKPLVEFSGGQQNRAILARLLLRSPGVMLLDEPTNHLDIVATEWLEGYLSRCESAVILVSHDRYFLDRVTTRIFEMNNARLTSYTGNFSAYWRQRDERATLLERTFEKQRDLIAKTENFIRRNKYGQKHAQAADREKKLERINQVELPNEIATPAMTFGSPSRTGDWVIDATSISKGFDTVLFEDLTLRIHRGDRIGILGPNGSGKTTLLRTLVADLAPDAGSVRFGTGVKVGYFDQHLSSVKADIDAVEAVRPHNQPEFTPAMARSLLARFGIRGDLALQKVGAMSGGEKSKVALAKVAAQNVNLLVLDEPTNHLDLWARESLERALGEFDGTLIFVSHDRYFVDRVAAHVIVLEPDRWRFYEGNYSRYVEFRKNQSLEASLSGTGSGTEHVNRSTEASASISAAPENALKPKRKRRFPYRKASELEAEIAGREEQLEQLKASLADPETHRDGERAKRTLQAFEQTQKELEEFYAHWEEAVELN